MGELQLQNFVKMSKSLQNTISIETLLQKCTPDVFRMVCLQSHYRNSIEYSEDLFVTAENNLKKFRFLLNDLNAYLKGTLSGNLNPDILSTTINDAIIEIDVAFKDDFNTPNVLKALNKLSSLTSKMIHSTSSNFESKSENFYILAVIEIVSNTLNNCGINLKTTALKESSGEFNFSTIMNVLHEFRCGVRNFAIDSKNQELLKICDKVREDVGGLGIKINDYGRKSEWIK